MANVVRNARRGFVKAFFFLVLSVVASQCFAKSSAGDEAQAQNQKYLEIINTLYYYIQQNYVEEVDPKTLYEGALRGMLGSLNDPYSVYMPEDDWRGLTDTTVGNFGGVGLSITKPNENTPEKPAYVEVAQPIENSPGAKAGIQPGDLIVKIDGVDTSTLTMNQVLGMLRGTVGESVVVTIRRGKTMEFDRTLVRAIIENPTVKYGMIGTIGYIRISEFSSNTATRVQEGLDSFKASPKYTGLIIDLRNNGGGLLTSAVDIADKFIDSGTIVSTKSRISYENATYKATKRKTQVRNFPVVVLINGASASASEIVSGALKDAKAAYLVGERTYGKGSVQIPSGLINNDGFKITVARYYSPSDCNIDKVGIPPDTEYKYPEFTEEQEKAFSSIMDSTVIEDYVEAHPNMTDDDIASYAKKLQATYPLELRVLRKLVRNEVERTKPARLYDLDYDLQLGEALRILREENFKALMAKTKTLKQLEDESQNKAPAVVSGAPEK